MTRCQSAQNHLYKDIGGQTDEQTNRQTERNRGTDKQNEIKQIKSNQNRRRPSCRHPSIDSSFIHSFIHAFIVHSSIHSSIHSFIHSFIPTGHCHSLGIAIAIAIAIAIPSARTECTYFPMGFQWYYTTKHRYQHHW